MNLASSLLVAQWKRRRRIGGGRLSREREMEAMNPSVEELKSTMKSALFCDGWMDETRRKEK